MFKMILGTMALILLALQPGCAVKPGPVFSKGGKEYGRIEGIWGGNFWNFYERGLSYSEGEFWTPAIDDFRQSIRLKDRDQRRVRTYGLHILDDYFPHREIGIAYYAMADYQSAIQELSYSLECYPSAKAKYYLNRSREALLRQTRQDTASPRIFITSHQDRQLVNDFEAVIEGRAWDDCFIGKIMVNGVPYPCELSRQDMPFSATIDLKAGVNEVKIVATDLVGKETVASLHLTADRQAPLLYLDDLQILQEGSRTAKEIQIEGYIQDLCGVKTFQIDHQEVSLRGDEGRFLFRSPLDESATSLPFVAEDRLGNRVEGRIGIEGDQHDISSSEHPMQIASLQLAGLSGPDMPGTRDTQPPAVRLDAPKGDLTVDWETLFICGEVQDAGGIRDLLVNDESILSGDGRKRIYFNYILKLPIGKTTIAIKAIDLAGNEKTKSVTIVRKVNPVHQIASRMSMAIIPFTQRGKEDRNDHQDFMNELLVNAFVTQGRFSMVDRQRIDRVVRQLQHADGGNREVSPLELGKLVSAETVLAGHIYENKGFIEIVARLIDIETSAILDSQDVYGPAGLENLKTLLEGLALKFKHSFPLVEGVIVEKDGRSIFVNLGKAKNIKEFTKFIVFRDGRTLKDPVTQKVLESLPDVLGEAKIMKVFEQTSQADIIVKDQQKTVRVKDRVITK